jgi:hypothetical protein
MVIPGKLKLTAHFLPPAVCGFPATSTSKGIVLVPTPARIKLTLGAQVTQNAQHTPVAKTHLVFSKSLILHLEKSIKRQSRSQGSDNATAQYERLY